MHGRYVLVTPETIEDTKLTPGYSRSWKVLEGDYVFEQYRLEVVRLVMCTWASRRI
jgi:hypothetical protein